MLYTDKNGNLITRAAAIDNLTKELGTAVINPSYFDDVTLSLFGITPVKQTNQSTLRINTTEKRKALESVDWITNAEHITKESKQKIENWRWLVRNLPESVGIPPLPVLEQKTNYCPKTELTEKECEAVKNYVTVDSGWMLFLEIWKSFGFSKNKQTIIRLLGAYTNLKINEIIGSI